MFVNNKHFSTWIIAKWKDRFFADGDKRVHSEISRGLYVTEYYGLSLPNFLVHLQSQNYVIMDIDVEEKLN